MDRKKMQDIRKEIARLINNIKEHSDLMGDRERIPQLELELILNKIEKLYQKSIVFNYLHQEFIDQSNEPSGRTAEAVQVGSPVSEVVADEVAVSELPANTPELIEEPVVESPAPQVNNEPYTAPVEQGVKERAGKFVATPSIHDRIAKSAEELSLGDKLRETPVEDLTKAIGINQRFTFIQALFDNDSKAFAEAIRNLNGYSTFAEAGLYIERELAGKFNWKPEENPHVDEFLGLVRRRYLK